MDLSLAEVTIPGVERFKPDALKRKDEADLKKLATWREKQTATAAEASPTRWKQRKARGGFNGTMKIKQQEPPTPHDAAEEYTATDEEQDETDEYEHEEPADAEAEQEEQEEQSDEQQYDEAVIRIPRGAMLDMFWSQVSPAAAISLLNGIASASRSAPRELAPATGDPELRARLASATQAMARARAEAKAAHSAGERAAQEKADAHIKDLRASVARLEKELASKGKDREEKLVAYIEQLLGKNASGSAIGAAGEEVVDAKLGEMFPEYNIENINEERKATDLMATHRDDGFRVLIEVKNKTIIAPKDREEFESAVRLNIKGAHAALFLALRVDRVPMRGKFQRAQLGRIPAVYLAGVIADNWQPARLAIEMLHSEYLSASLEDKRARDRESLLSEALHDMLKVGQDLASARRQTAALGTTLSGAVGPADRVLGVLRLHAPGGFEQRDGRKASAPAKRATPAPSAAATKVASRAALAPAEASQSTPLTDDQVDSLLDEL